MNMSINVHHSTIKSVTPLSGHDNTITVKFGSEESGYDGITLFWTLEEVEQAAIKLYSAASTIRMERELAVQSV